MIADGVALSLAGGKGSARSLVRHRVLPPVVLALSMFGYPLVGNIVSMLGVDSRVISIPFRLLVLGLAAVVIVNTAVIHLTRGRVVLLVIWLAYAARLVHDLAIARIDGAGYALQFFIAGCVIPAIAQLAADDYQQVRFATIAFLLATIGCAATVLGSSLGRFGEAELTGATSRLSTVALNPVSLGHLAVSGLLCALVLWRVTGNWARAWLLVGGSVALYTLVMTGSKGPALALVVCGSAWAAARGALLRVLLVAIPLAVLVLVSPASPLAARVAGLGEDLSTLERVILLQDTILQIADAPLFGSAFVELNSGLYPHVVFLDAALAFGIPLAMVFAALVGLGAVRAWRTLRTANDLLGLLFLQMVVAGFLSDALFASAGLWSVLAVLLGPSFVRMAPRRGA